MNIQMEGNSGVMVDGRKKIAIVHGKKYPFIKGMTGNNVTTINGKIYVDGFELVRGKWKRTIRAMWHLWF